MPTSPEHALAIVICARGGMPIVLSDAVRARTLLTPELTSLIDEKAAALRTAAGLAAILDGIGEGFYAVDADWRIILFNNEASRYFQLAPEAVLGRVLWEALPGARDSRLGQIFVRVMQSRDTVRDEEESVVFPGRWMAFRLFPLGDGMGVVFRDITDRKRAEEQRDLLVKELEHRVKNTLSIVQSIATGASSCSTARRRSTSAAHRRICWAASCGMRCRVRAKPRSARSSTK